MGEIATINSVEHAIRLVELLANSEDFLGVSHMAQCLNLPRATVYRLLKTLIQKEWVIQEEKKYHLSLRLNGLFVSVGAGAQAALVERIKPLLQMLVSETGESTHFAVLDGDRVVYLARVDSPHPIRMFSQVGWRGPLHSTAVGKILLALNEERLLNMICEHGLERFTSKTLVEKRQLQIELAKVREQGYALDNEELISGLTCVAVPVIREGKVLGAISVSGPTSRVGDPRVLAELLNAAAKTLQK